MLDFRKIPVDSYTWMAPFLLVAGFFLWPTLFFGFVWDDHWLFQGNPAVIGDLSWSDLFSSNAYGGYYWRPLTLFTFWLDQHLGQGSPLNFHATNLILNACTLVLFIVLSRKWNIPNIVAFVAVLIWALHPIRVESVAFISARDNLLLANAVLLGMILFEMTMTTRSFFGAGLWMFVFFGALFIKEGALILPLLTLLRLCFFTYPSSGKGWSQRKGFLLVLSSFPILAVYLGLRFLFFGPLPFQFSISANSILMPCHLFGYSLRHLLLPAPLVADTFDPSVFQFSDMAALWPDFILCLVFLAAFAWSLKKDKMLALYLGWFTLSLLPYLNFIPTPGRITSDTWLLLPSLGLILALTHIARSLLVRTVRPGGYGFLLTGLVLVPLAVQSARYLPVWKSDESLFVDILEKHPSNPRPYAWLGHIALEKGQLKEASVFFQKGITANPKYGENYIGMAAIALTLGNREEGRRWVEETLRVEPDHIGAITYMARLDYEQGQYERALERLESIPESSTNYLERFIIRSTCLKELGRMEEAKKVLKTYCRITTDERYCKNPELE